MNDSTDEKKPKPDYPLPYTVWRELLREGPHSVKSIAAEVSSHPSSVRAILLALVREGYADREWLGLAKQLGGSWVYRVLNDPAPLVPRVVIGGGSAHVELLGDRLARGSLTRARRHVSDKIERSATDRACTATLRYGLRDAARLLLVSSDWLAERTRGLTSIDPDECSAIMRSIGEDGEIVGPIVSFIQEPS